MIESAGLGDYFLLHGWMDKSKLVPFLARQAHMILIPSHYEGLPLILLEALYLNKPFLISDLGLLEEYAVPAAWRFDPRNPRDIAQRIIDLRAHFDAAEHAALRERVLALHSRERFHADVAEVFGRLSGREAQTPPRSHSLS
jgi:glycosyltransferase involved in cell wall biosynthesis